MSDKTVLFLDNDFLVKTYKAAGQNEVIFHRILDGYTKDYDIRITDVVRDEAVNFNDINDSTGQPYPKDIAVNNWLDKNNITELPTSIDLSDPSIKNKGEKSIVEAIKNDPDLYDSATGMFKPDTFEIASNDKGFLASKGDTNPAPQADREMFDVNKKNAQTLAEQQTVKGNISLEDYKKLSENSQVSSEPFKDHKPVTKQTIENKYNVDVDYTVNPDKSVDYTARKGTHSVTISEAELFAGESKSGNTIIYHDGTGSSTSKTLLHLGKYGSAIDKAGFIGDIIGVSVALTESATAFANGDARGAGRILAEATGEVAGGFAAGTAAAAIVGSALLASGAPVAAVGGALLAGFAGGYYGGKIAGEVVKEIYDDVANVGIIPYIQDIAKDFAWALSNPMEIIDNLFHLGDTFDDVAEFYATEDVEQGNNSIVNDIKASLINSINFIYNNKNSNNNSTEENKDKPQFGDRADKYDLHSAIIPKADVFQGSTLVGFTHDDILIGTNGNDVIKGGEGRDTIISGNGNDNISNGENVFAGMGNDHIYIHSETKGGRYTLNGGSGDDTYDIRANGKVSIMDTTGSNEIVLHVATALNVRFGDGDDKIHKLNSVRETGGIQKISLGDGNNSLTLGSVRGGAITSGNGNDSVNINALGTLSVNMGNGNNFALLNGKGKITIQSGNGEDRISVGTESTSVINAGNGNNIITANGKVLRINSGDGDDDLKISKLEKYSIINAGSGNNTLKQYEGLLNYKSGGGNDNVYLKYDASVLGDSINNINLGDGNNILSASSAASININSGNQSSNLNIRSDNNVTVNTGYGDDVINISTLKSATINAGDGKNSVNVSRGEYYYINTGVDDDLITIKGHSNINGGDGNNHITHNGGRLNLTLGKGDDYVHSNYYGDIKELGTYNINLGDGKNYLSMRNLDSAEITSGNDDDYMKLMKAHGKISINTENGKDFLEINTQDGLEADLGSGDDYLRAYMSKKSKIDTGNGDDYVNLWGDADAEIQGGYGDDVLISNSGSQLLIDGIGSDYMSGGDGADIYKLVYEENVNDWISGFEEHDKIDLSEYDTIKSYKDIAIYEPEYGRVILDLGQDRLAIIEGEKVSIDWLSDDMFIV